MGFTPYSEAVEPAKWVDPMDLNLYAKSMMYKQELAEKNLKNFTDKFTSAFNLPAYGIDAEHLSKLEDDFKNKLGSMNLSNLGDMSTISQMNSLMNQYTSGATKESKDLMAIAKRGSIYRSELKNKEEAEEKGLGYSSPAYETLSKYYNGNEFYEKPKGVNLSRGWTSPPVKEWMKEARDAVKKQIINTKTGMVEEVVDPIEARNYFMQLGSSDPRFPKELNWSFEKQYGDTDWSTEGQNYVKEKIEEEKAKIIQARLQGDKESEIISTRQLERLENMSDPDLIGEELKGQALNSWIENEMDKIGYTMNNVSFKDYKRDPVYMEMLKTQNNVQEALLKKYIDAGLDPYTQKPITVGGKPLTEIEARQVDKKESSKSERNRNRETVLNQIRQSGKVTQDQVNLLAERNESADLFKDPNTNQWMVTISYPKGVYPDGQGGYITVEESKPPNTMTLSEFIANRTNVSFKVGESGELSTPKESSVKIARPK